MIIRINLIVLKTLITLDIDNVRKHDLKEKTRRQNGAKKERIQ